MLGFSARAVGSPTERTCMDTYFELVGVQRYLHCHECFAKIFKFTDAAQGDDNGLSETLSTSSMSLPALHSTAAACVILAP
jgi:hypothetical protein